MQPSDLSLRYYGPKPKLVPHKLDPLLLFEHGKTWCPSIVCLTGIPTKLPSMVSGADAAIPFLLPAGNYRLQRKIIP